MRNSLTLFSFTVLVALSSITGCISTPTSDPTAQAKPSSRPAVTKTSHSLVGENLVAIDLVNALVQVAELNPENAQLELKDPANPFNEHLLKALNALGYRLNPTDNETAIFAVQSSITQNNGVVPSTSNGVGRTYQIDVGSIKIKRDYLFENDRVKPRSHMYFQGADSSGIKLNDSIFHDLDDDVNLVRSRETPSVNEISRISPNSANASSDSVIHDNAPSGTKAIANSHSATTATNDALAGTTAIAGLTSQTSISQDIPSGTMLTHETQQATEFSRQQVSVDLPTAPLLMQLEPLYDSTGLDAGDSIRLSVVTSRDSQVHCYYQDGSGVVARLFPNRFKPDSVLRAGETLILPESGKWELTATRSGADETFMCIAVAPDLLAQLHDTTMQPDLQPLPVEDLTQIYQRYKSAAGVELVNQRISVAVR